MRNIFLPYEKRNPILDSFRVLSKKEFMDNLEGESREYLVYVLEEKRSDNWVTIANINVDSTDLWGGELSRILSEINNPLNDVVSYKWEKIKTPIIDFWYTKQQKEREKDLAAGGKGQWTVMNDFTLNQLMLFIAAIFGIKWEIIGSLPTELPEWINSHDAFEKELTLMAFDEAIVRDEIQKTIDSISDENEVARKIVQLIIHHSNNLLFFSRRFLLDPEYEVETQLLSKEEEFEQDALWGIYQEEERMIEEDQSLFEEEKILKKQTFWHSELGKRLAHLSNRGVYGGTLPYQEKENRKRVVAYETAHEFFRIVSSWGLSYQAAKEGQKEYIRLYTREVWNREKREIEFQDIIRKSQSDLKQFTELMRDEWDSNSLTFFGVVIAIIFTVIFGVLSLLPNILLWQKVAITVVSAILSFGLIYVMIILFRKDLLLWARQILQGRPVKIKTKDEVDRKALK